MGRIRESTTLGEAQQYLYFLYLGNVDQGGAGVWTGWVYTDPEVSRDKARGIAYEGNCDVTLLRVPRAPVVSATPAVEVEVVTLGEAKEYYLPKTLRNAKAKTEDETLRKTEEALCLS